MLNNQGDNSRTYNQPTFTLYTLYAKVHASAYLETPYRSQQTITYAKQQQHISRRISFHSMVLIRQIREHIISLR